MCPHCKSCQKPTKRGFYKRPSDSKNLQRFRCLDCKRTFSEQRFSIEFRLRKRRQLQLMFRLLTRGMSQRAIAEEFGLHRDSIARRVERFAHCARNNLTVYRESREKVSVVQIDEMISFEHTKCKPVTVPIAVEQDTRRILSLSVGSIAAFGHLAAISRKKYGFRKCERRACLETVFTELKTCTVVAPLIKSDRSHHYPPLIKKYYPHSKHETSKGQRGCVVGQGELKRGGFDPIFSLNHSYAMFRDNVKRLSRRTWCTTKKILCLEQLLYMYAWRHNQRLDSKKPLKLEWLSHPFK